MTPRKDGMPIRTIFQSVGLGSRKGEKTTSFICTNSKRGFHVWFTDDYPGASVSSGWWEASWVRIRWQNKKYVRRKQGLYYLLEVQPAQIVAVTRSGSLTETNLWEEKKRNLSEEVQRSSISDRKAHLPWLCKGRPNWRHFSLQRENDLESVVLELLWSFVVAVVL